MNAELTYSIQRLQQAAKLYWSVSQKSDAEVVVKQSKELAFDIRRSLRNLAPTKGSIRSEQLSAMRNSRGRGLHVRQAAIQSVAEKYGIALKATGVKDGKPVFGSQAASWAEKKGARIKGKHLNLRQLAVARELNIRESGIGFLSISTPRTSELDGTVETGSRYGHELSEFFLDTSVEDKYSLLRWVGGKGTALQGLALPRQQEVLNEAIQYRIDDMIKYVKNKTGIDIKEAGLS